MTEELKETIIREHPDGIWLVLAEENPPDVVTAHDLLCGSYPSTDHTVSAAHELVIVCARPATFMSVCREVQV